MKQTGDNSSQSNLKESRARRKNLREREEELKRKVWSSKEIEKK